MKNLDIPRVRKNLNQIIFGVDTPAGKAFDVFLLWIIILSVVLVLLESVSAFRLRFSPYIKIGEWLFTLLFTIEYILRICVVQRPLKYAGSFFGVVDLVAILPSYVSLFFPWSHSLLVIRGLRLLRIFRIFKLARFSKQSNVLLSAFRASREKIIVFLGAVFTLVLILGTVMYLIEGEQNGFTSIPKSIYWAIVTMTTVGYGDITPQTVPGQLLSAIIMILGYAIIAVPTGIVSVELSQSAISFSSEDLKQKNIPKLCPQCRQSLHDADASYCKYCGHSLI